MKEKLKLKNDQNDWNVRDSFIEALALYVKTGAKPGDFLTGVLENDLGKAIKYADGKAEKNLANIFKLIYHTLPIESWGSPAKVQKWEGTNYDV